MFVDPISSIVVDQKRNIDRLEGLSFSLLHKWSHLTPLIGPQWRDSIMIITLLAYLTLAGLGIQIYRRRKTQAKRS